MSIINMKDATIHTWNTIINITGRLDTDQIDYVIEMTNKQDINTVSIHCGALGKLNATKIANALCENDNITTVTLGYFLPLEDVIVIAIPLLNKNKLHGLHMPEVYFENNDYFVKLCDALKNAVALKVFEIFISHEANNAVGYLINMMITNTTLTELSIIHTGYMAQHIEYLMNNNDTLQVLRFTRSMIDDDCAKIIACALKNNKTLRMLDLTTNHISIEGAVAIANSLTTNETLNDLRLANNWMIKTDESEIIQIFEKNYTLTNLTIRTKIDDFQKITERNRFLAEKRRFNKVKVAV